MAFSDISPFGIPYEVLAVILAAAIVVAYLFFRSSVEGMPVYAKWVTETGVTWRFRAKEDLRGVFIDIMDGKGKVIEQVKKFGIPLDISDVENAKAYLVKFSDDTKKVYLTVRPSRMKNYREYTVLEGTGLTVDYKGMAKQAMRPDFISKVQKAESLLRDGKDADPETYVQAADGLLQVVKESQRNANSDAGNTLLLHEESSAFKQLLKDLKEGGKSMMDMLFDWIPGIGIGMALTFLILILLGKPI